MGEGQQRTPPDLSREGSVRTKLNSTSQALLSTAAQTMHEKAHRMLDACTELAELVAGIEAVGSLVIFKYDYSPLAWLEEQVRQAPLDRH